jgi:ribosomal protein S18 acetylase RimI-like enzyme
MTTARLANKADIPGLLAIEDEFQRTGTAAWAVMDEVWLTRKIEQAEILVAADDNVVAYLAWTTIWRLPWIEFVRVLAARRRQGIGRQLVQTLEDRLRATGGFALVSSSAGTDEDAIAWHRAVGFKDGGRIEWKMWSGMPPEVLHYKQL